jgi:hypothetical protein
MIVSFGDSLPIDANGNLRNLNLIMEINRKNLMYGGICILISLELFCELIQGEFFGSLLKLSLKAMKTKKDSSTN